LDNYFSIELKELVSQSREIAIDLGYDYISTIHFFLADCESKSENSILKFGFKDEIEYRNFKKHCKLAKADLLDLIDENLPLTKEAELTIRLAETERILNKQLQCYPFHLFIAALKNKESLLFECFQNDKDALEKLTQYYRNLGEFEKEKLTENEISRQYYDSERRTGNSFLNKISKLLKLTK